MDKKWSVYLALVCLVLSSLAPVSATTDTKVFDQSVLLNLYDNGHGKPCVMPSNMTISSNHDFKFMSLLVFGIIKNDTLTASPYLGSIGYILLDSSGNWLRTGSKALYFDKSLFNLGRFKSVNNLGTLPKGDYTLRVYYTGSKKNGILPRGGAYHLHVVK